MVFFCLIVKPFLPNFNHTEIIFMLLNQLLVLFPQAIFPSIINLYIYPSFEFYFLPQLLGLVIKFSWALLSLHSKTLPFVFSLDYEVPCTPYEFGSTIFFSPLVIKFFFFFYQFQYSFLTETIKIIIIVFTKRRYALLNALFLQNLDSFSTGPELKQALNTVHEVWFHGSAKSSTFCFSH